MHLRKANRPITHTSTIVHSIHVYGPHGRKNSLKKDNNRRCSCCCVLRVSILCLQSKSKTVDHITHLCLNTFRFRRHWSRKFMRKRTAYKRTHTQTSPRRPVGRLVILEHSNARNSQLHHRTNNANTDSMHDLFSPHSSGALFSFVIFLTPSMATASRVNLKNHNFTFCRNEQCIRKWRISQNDS